MKVYEAGRPVGVIVWRSSGWFQFVPFRSYWATGLAAQMDEECTATEAELVARLRSAGLEVREDG